VDDLEEDPEDPLVEDPPPGQVEAYQTHFEQEPELGPERVPVMHLLLDWQKPQVGWLRVQGEHVFRSHEARTKVKTRARAKKKVIVLIILERRKRV